MITPEQVPFTEEGSVIWLKALGKLLRLQMFYKDKITFTDLRGKLSAYSSRIRLHVQQDSNIK